MDGNPVILEFATETFWNLKRMVKRKGQDVDYR